MFYGIEEGAGGKRREAREEDTSIDENDDLRRDKIVRYLRY